MATQPKPTRGIVTYDSEGVESPGSLFHSRVLHVPSNTSGVTIGRGYDMKLKDRAKIEGGAGRQGCRRRKQKKSARRPACWARAPRRFATPIRASRSARRRR